MNVAHRTLRRPEDVRLWAGLPLPVWGAVLSCACMIIGWVWDICWHRSIGRDTVWTPPHIAIYIALIVAFAYNAWLVLSHTFGASKGVLALSVLGFRGPAGSLMTLCGILLQFLAILWDDWWHDIYGVDSQVNSPPHTLIAYGVILFYIGQLVVILQYRNAALREREVSTRWAALVLWSFFLGHMAIGSDGVYGPMGIRAHAFAHTSALFFPVALLTIHRALNWKWAAPACAALYTGSMVLIMQAFQLFPATPQFGPVFHRLDHFLPPAFPLPLIVPALVFALLLARGRNDKAWSTIALLGFSWVVSFTAMSWLQSWFMTTEWSDNRIFAGGFPAAAFWETWIPTHSMGYDVSTIGTLLLAFVLASFSAWGGLAAGRWMRGVVR